MGVQLPTRVPFPPNGTAHYANGTAEFHAATSWAEVAGSSLAYGMAELHGKCVYGRNCGSSCSTYGRGKVASYIDDLDKACWSHDKWCAGCAAGCAPAAPSALPPEPLASTPPCLPRGAPLPTCPREQPDRGPDLQAPHLLPQPAQALHL